MKRWILVLFLLALAACQHGSDMRAERLRADWQRLEVEKTSSAAPAPERALQIAVEQRAIEKELDLAVKERAKSAKSAIGEWYKLILYGMNTAVGLSMLVTANPGRK